MPVSIHRDLNATVPHLFLDVGQALLVLNQEARKGMAHILKTHMPESDLREDLGPGA